MDESNRDQENTVPNVHVPENERVLAYLKEMNPFREIIVPFSPEKVSKDITPSDFIGRFSAMASLPENSKYVVYGSEALVQPETGIIFGFITGTSMIYRLPDNILKEVMEGNLVNFYVVNDIDGNGMENLEDNWVSSPSITEQLVHKCFEYYGQAFPEEVVHLNFDVDLTTPRTREFENRERTQRLLPLGVMIVISAISLLLWYAADYVLKLL